MNQFRFFPDTMNNIVDSHCHLDFLDFKKDLDEVLKRAQKKNVNFFLTISINLKDFKNIKLLTEQYPNIWCTTGIHPNNVPELINERKINRIFSEIETNLNFKKVVGLGETGLDFFRGIENKKNQLTFFDNHLYLSGKNNIPSVIHTRSADEDTIKMIEKGVKHYKSRGLIHCFSSGKNLAKAALDNQFYISISGIVTFKKSELLRKVIEYIPIEKLLIETDAPYLAPVPKRGKRNEPSFLEYTLKEISKIKKMNIEEISYITTKNFFNLFNKIEI